MSKLFKKYWDNQDSNLTKSRKRIEDLKVGDTIVEGISHDTIQSIDASGDTTHVTGRNYNYMFKAGDTVEVLDIEKSKEVILLKSELDKIDKEVFKAKIQKQNNPWAICTESVGRDDKAKFESCVMHLKDKFGIKKEMDSDAIKEEIEVINNQIHEEEGMRPRDPDLKKKLLSKLEELNRALSDKLKEEKDTEKDTSKTDDKEILDWVNQRYPGGAANEKHLTSIVNDIWDHFGDYSQAKRIGNKISIKDTKKDVGIGYAGPIPSSGLARQDLEGEIKTTKSELSVPEKHQLKIARDTLKMSDAGANVMGGPTKEEAKEIIARLEAKMNKSSETKKAVIEHKFDSEQERYIEASVKHGGNAKKIADEIGLDEKDVQEYIDSLKKSQLQKSAEFNVEVEFYSGGDYQTYKEVVSASTPGEAQRKVLEYIRNNWEKVKIISIDNEQIEKSQTKKSFKEFWKDLNKGVETESDKEKQYEMLLDYAQKLKAEGKISAEIERELKNKVDVYPDVLRDVMWEITRTKYK